MRLRRGQSVLFALLLSGTTALAGQGPPASDYLRVLRWIDAALTHRPGAVDDALLEVSAWRALEYEVVRVYLERALAQRFSNPAERHDVIRRGILLHTDIALLLPERAARFTELPPARPDRHGRPREERSSTHVAAGFDGQFVDSEAITAHWLYARLLARRLSDPSKDPFVSAWYRATTARFEADYLLGFAEPHVAEALRLLPRDPWLQFYRGALYEALAAPRYQNIARTGPDLRRAGRTLASADKQLRRAEECFREALALDPQFAEARVRLGHVLLQRGDASEALTHLRQVLSDTRDPVLTYFGQLFAGAAFEVLNLRAEAARAFEEAAAIAPTAQTPLLALSALARRSGDRRPALAAVERLARLPADPAPRIDPWWNYLRSFAWDADQQLEKVRHADMGR
jgi:tetratricopeptide (TPR) repeat protein